MKINDIITALNSDMVEFRKNNNIKKSGQFILQVTIKPEKIQLFKKFEYILWYVESAESKYRILYKSSIERCPEDEKLKVREAVDKAFLKNIIAFLRSQEYNDILRGTYDGN